MDKIQNIQKKIGVMKKDTQGYNYKYFDINQLLEKLTPLLHEEGLVMMQPLTNVNGRPAIQTIIYEQDENSKLGWVIVSDTSITLPDLPKPQDMGSAITYYRRYSLQSLFALEAEDDDAQLDEKKKVTKKDYQQKNKEDYDNNVDPLYPIIDDEI